MSEKSSPVIELTRLSRRYGRRWALVDVSFALPSGSSLLVAGRNGSGKSTLLKVLATALRPDMGNGRICGLDLVSDRDQVRRRIALLGHYLYSYDVLTALENLQITARLMGRRGEDSVLRDLLGRVGLGDRAGDVVNGFSAGMRKRLAIARLLLQEAEVVLLDEPYSQLDPPGFRMLDEILAEVRSKGATLVIATHQLERGGPLCDRGIVLEQGQLIWQGDVASVPENVFAGGEGA